MTFESLEAIVLRKLKAGLLDGIIEDDIHHSVDRRVYRKLIVNGTPWFINFPEGEEPTQDNVVVDGHWETDEMKLFFLSMNGKHMTDPDVIAYSQADNEYPQ